ncbi:MULTISPECIES: Cpg1 family polymorphic protein [Ehrlichia]|uniref:Uncharacterized protein n=1 Tax=Ehrlichia cf. muris str. EmCRT TaxID=1359167 RepID=A0A0F3NDQ4_9RICK|nr:MULTISPECIES: hypothetical protein [Ehrlichia]KJV65847.1 hypothetical protein EMUCRT_0028 [Ehrlichia cf. muris str. EmCRT]OUC04132.1 hypothetical protein DB91_04285 [Ehrlichia sp. Wisconsin_h]
MPGKSELSNNQLKLYTKVQQHIKNNQVTKNLSLLPSPISYFSYKVNSLFFGSKNTSHEKCVMVSEEFTSDLILESADFESFTLVTKHIDKDFKEQCHNNGILFLCNLLTPLIKHISSKLATSGISSHPISEIEGILSTNMPLGDNNFNPGDIACYEEFINGILNQSNQDVLLREAEKVLNIICPLTCHVLLIRGIAHAILNKRTPNPTSHKEHVAIEAKTATLLHIAAITHTTRESTMRAVNAAFAREHPYQSRVLAITNYFNQYISDTVSWVYVGAIFSVFVTRIYSGYASDRAEQDVQKALSASGHSINFNHTRYYRPDINYHNSTNSTVIYAPRHPSEYFPEHEGVLNGVPGYLTTAISTVQLFLTLPNMILSQRKRQFVLRSLDKYSPTPEEQKNNAILMSTLIFRWVGNVVVQPVDCIDSVYKDTFFKWSVFRFFTPSAPLEEPLKLQNIYNCLNRHCYRSQSTPTLVNHRIMFLAAVSTTALEYVDAALGFPNLICSALLKGTRLLSVIIPVVTNRNKVCYIPRFKKFVLVNMVRTATSPAILPAFDQIGSHIRYVGLLTALDVLATVNADAISGRILSEASAIEEQLVVIEDLIRNATQNHIAASLVLFSPVIERRFQRLRSNVTITEILEDNQEEEQVQSGRRQHSRSITETQNNESICETSTLLPSEHNNKRPLRQSHVVPGEVYIEDPSPVVQLRSYRRNAPDCHIIDITDENEDNEQVSSTMVNISLMGHSSRSPSLSKQ